MARQGVVDAIWLAWRNPRPAMAEQLAGGLTEGRALVLLLLACGQFFVASLPNAVREARLLEIDDPVGGAIAAHAFAWFALAPLVAYALAVPVHLAARACGGQRPFFAARAAIFWSALALAPVTVTLALAGVAAELLWPRLLPLMSVLGYAGLAFWLWLFAASLAEAEGFAATGRVAAAVAAAFACLAGIIALAAGGAMA
jgi:hypothetical protein